MPPAVRTVTVPIVRPAFDEAERQAVANVVASGWLMQGPHVERFESAFARVVGAPHAVALANGTVALELTLRALGIGAGDEVITVSHSFIATANSVVAVGAMPVFVDVEPDGLSMDARAVSAAVTPRTKAILCVHQLGFVCDGPTLRQLADRAGVALIEDAACALGTEVDVAGRWQGIGVPHGHAACFSFHPRKVVTTGEGGAVSTADPQLAARIRQLRQHAIPPMAAEPDPASPDGYVVPAFNARMTDMAAAIGMCQLDKLPWLLRERRRQADALTARLSSHRVLEPPRVRALERPNWQSYPARIRAGANVRARDVLACLKREGVSARGGLTNAHEEPAYTQRPHLWRALDLTVSEALRRHVIMLPIFPGMTAEEQLCLAHALEALDALT